MARKSKIKRKAETAGQASANVRKKRRVSSEEVESISAGNETTPSLVPVLSVAETPATDDVSVAGPSSGVVGVSANGGSSGQSSGVASVACTGDAGPSGLEGTSVAGPSGLAEEAGAGIEEETGAGSGSGSGSDYSLKTSQDILGKFVEDSLETLDKE